MGYASDDLVPLLTRPDPSGVGFRQGVILSWDQTTAENAVQVGGATLTNLPILNGAEALLLGEGDVVGVLTAGPAWFILGRITVPGSPAAAATFGAGLQVASVTASSSISSASYALNSGPTVTTTVLPTGRVYLTASAGMNVDVGEGVTLAVVATGPDGVTLANVYCYLSGQNLLTTTSGTLGGTIATAGSAAELVTGLTPGEWTFELHSRKTSGTGNPDVHSRVLTALPF